MAKRRIRRYKPHRARTTHPVVLKHGHRQIGKSVRTRDVRRHAMYPGKRRSRTGHTYY